MTASPAAQVPELAELRARLIGHEFPGGEFSVEEHERWLSHEAMKSPPIKPPLLHPVWVLLGSLRGMGMTIEELVALADVSPDGVLFGETELEQLEPLRTGVRYAVSGRIVSLERRQGKRAGTFDVLAFRMEISGTGDDEGRLAASSTQSFLIMRQKRQDG